MNNEVNEVSNDLIIISFKFNIVLIFICYIYIIQTKVKNVCKKMCKKGQAGQKKAKLQRKTEKKSGGGTPYLSICNNFSKSALPLMILYYV